MADKKRIGYILAIIGSVLLMIGGLTVFATIALTEMEIQALIATYKPSYPTLSITVDYTLIIVEGIFIIAMAAIGIICAILIQKENKVGAFIAMGLGIFVLISAFIPIGVVTMTITGVPGLSIESIPVTLGATFIFIDPILISIGGIVGFLGIREG